MAYSDNVNEPGGGLLAGQRDTEPRQPLGHLARLGYALERARDLDGIARSVIRHLAALPGVRRVGLALVEGGGRRLRFVQSDLDLDGKPAWRHIDAYDDVPLTSVVRSGEPVLASVEELGDRFARVAEEEREDGSVAMAVLPLPGPGSPVGGLLITYRTPQPFDEPQLRLLEAVADRTGEALRQVRAAKRRRTTLEAALGPETSGARTAKVILDDDPRAASVARRFIGDEVRRWGVAEEYAETAQLCLSEIVTNAYIHAGTPCEVLVGLDAGVLSVMVRDQGGQAEEDAAPLTDEDPMRVHGRGLMLVEALTSRWGSERDKDGMTVWFVIELDNNLDKGSQAG